MEIDGWKEGSQREQRRPASTDLCQLPRKVAALAGKEKPGTPRIVWTKRRRSFIHVMVINSEFVKVYERVDYFLQLVTRAFVDSTNVDALDFVLFMNEEVHPVRNIWHDV